MEEVQDELLRGLCVAPGAVVGREVVGQVRAVDLLRQQVHLVQEQDDGDVGEPPERRETGRERERERESMRRRRKKNVYCVTDSVARQCVLCD